MNADEPGQSEIHRARLPTVNDEGPSPLWPRHLTDLFLRPRTFFSTNLALAQPLYAAIVTWSFGISSTISRLRGDMMRAEIGTPRPWWEKVGPLLTDSWWAFWIWVVLASVLNALFLWWAGGWWYRVRLRLSGARAPDKRRARLAYVYSSFVASGPNVVMAVAQTALYPNFAEAFYAEDWLAMFFFYLLIGLALLSYATSYVGVTTLFSVTKWKAGLLFGALPALAYAFALGLFAGLLLSQ